MPSDTWANGVFCRIRGAVEYAWLTAPQRSRRQPAADGASGRVPGRAEVQGTLGTIPSQLFWPRRSGVRGQQQPATVGIRPLALISSLGPPRTAGLPPFDAPGHRALRQKPDVSPACLWLPWNQRGWPSVRHLTDRRDGENVMNTCFAVPGTSCGHRRRRARSHRPWPPTEEASRVLVTGAAGFIGSHYKSASPRASWCGGSTPSPRSTSRAASAPTSPTSPRTPTSSSSRATSSTCSSTRRWTAWTPSPTSQGSRACPPRGSLVRPLRRPQRHGDPPPPGGGRRPRGRPRRLRVQLLRLRWRGERPAGSG